MQSFSQYLRDAARVPLPGARVPLTVERATDVLDHKPLYRVYRKDQPTERVGYAKLSGDGRSIMDVVIAPAWQRQGIASALYDFIERDRKITLRPSPLSQSAAGKAFWAARQARPVSEAPSDAAQVQALLSTKEVSDMVRRRMQRILDAADPVQVRQALVWLRKQPEAMSASSTATFDRVWKARPVFGPSFQRRGETTAAAMRRYATALTQYYRAHFGGPRIWTDAVMNRYLDAATQERPRIRYQGMTYPLTTGLDERDFVWAVLQQHRVTPV